MTTIGHKIKKIRELKDFKQDDIAARLNMSQQHYSRIERDEVELNDEKIKNIADVLGVSIETIEHFDDHFFFNYCQTHNTNSQLVSNGNITIEFPPDLKQLYEDQISLLKDKVARLEEELKKYKN